MRRAVVAAVVVVGLAFARPYAAGAPRRRPLGPAEREAVLALLKAVDLAQQTDVSADTGLAWTAHMLKSAEQLVYVPFRLAIDRAANMKTAALYVRAVSRHDGMR